MKIIVPILFVPDLVEELVVDSSGTALDRDALRWKLSEPDDHAIEQAILLKEKGGAEVTVLAPDLEGADDVLFTAAAKGAERLIKLTGDFEAGFNGHAVARAFLPIVMALEPDLILTGVQTHNGLDGALGALLAEYLGAPYIGYISGVSLVSGKATVLKDYPGGLRAEIEIALPAVLGIASAQSAPRYVPITKVRQMMKTCKIEDRDAGALDLGGVASVTRMFPPEVAERATMIKGSVEEVAAKLAALIKDQGLI